MAGTGPSERKRKRKKVANDTSESEEEEEEGASASENEWGDNDNNDYLDFLKEFLFPGQNSQNNSMEINDDDEADPEYNITEDEEEDHDREELRRDPAVKISKKELNELLAEVFDEPKNKSKSKHKKNTSDNNSINIDQPEVENQLQPPNQNQNQQDQSDLIVIPPDNNILNNSLVSLPVSDSKPPEGLPPQVVVENIQEPVPEPVISEVTFLKIKYQLQRHIQLLTQTYVLTAACSGSDDALKLAKESKRMISELYGFSINYGPMSVFNVKNIPYSFNLVNTWPASCIVSKSPIKKKILEERYMNEAIQISGGNGLIFTRNIVKIISENPAFMYPELLPLYPSLQSEYKINFTANEDALIAIGYREMQENSSYDFLKTRQKAKLIGDMLLPGRPTLQIFHRIKNARKMYKNERHLHHGLQTLRKYLSGEITPESPLNSWTPELLQIEPIAPIYQTQLPSTWVALTKRLKLDILFKDDIEENVGKKPRRSSMPSRGKVRKTQNQNSQLEIKCDNNNIEVNDKLKQSRNDQNGNSNKKRSARTKNSLQPVDAIFNGKQSIGITDGSTYVSLSTPSHCSSIFEETMERIPVMNKDGTPAAYVSIPKRFYRPIVEGNTPSTTSLHPSSSSSQITTIAPSEILDVTPVGVPFSLSVLQNENMSSTDTGCIIDVQSLESPLKREIFQRASEPPIAASTTPSVIIKTAITNTDENVKKSQKMILEPSSVHPTRILKSSRRKSSATEQNSPKKASCTGNSSTANLNPETCEVHSDKSVTFSSIVKISDAKAEPTVVHEYAASSREDHSARTWIYQRKSLEEIHAAIEKKLNDGKRETNDEYCSGNEFEDPVKINDSSSSQEDEEEDEDNNEDLSQVSNTNASNPVRYLSVPQLSPMPLDSDSVSNYCELNQNGELNTPHKLSAKKSPKKSRSFGERSIETPPQDAGDGKSDGSGNKPGTSGNSSGSGSSRATRGHGSGYRKDRQSGGRLGQTAGTGAGDGDGEDQDPLPPNKKNNLTDKVEDGEHKEDDTEDCDDDEKDTSDHSPPRRSHQKGKSETAGPKNQGGSQAPIGKKLKRSPGSQVKKRITKYKTAEIQKLLDDADSEVNVEAIETAFAEEFWTKCQHTVDPVLYNNLLQVFCDFEEKHSSEEEVFTKVEEMLKDYPDLLIDLATMIEPQLLQKNNLLKDNYVCQAYIRFMHLLEKLTLQCPPLKARVLQKLRAIRDLEKVTEKDVQELVDLYFQGNPIMTDALKALFPAIFPPESVVRTEDFEEINLDDDSVMGSTEEAMAIENINLPEETNIPATSSCPCDCHTDPKNVSYHAKARHCRKCCIKDGKVFMHSGRLMKQVNVAFTSKEKVEQILAGQACGHCFEPLKKKCSGSSDSKRKSVSKSSAKKRITAVSRLKGIIGSDADSEAEGIRDLGETEVVVGGGVQSSHIGNRSGGSHSQEDDDLEEGEIVDDEDYDAEGDDDHSEREIASSKSKQQQQQVSSSTSKHSHDQVKSHQSENQQHPISSREKEKQVQEKRKTEKSWTFDEDKIVLFTCQQEASPAAAIDKILKNKSLPNKSAEEIRDRLTYLLAMIRKAQVQTK